MDTQAFFEQLQRSRLLAKEAVDAVACRFSSATSSRVIARTLVSEGVLTSFQAKKILADKAHMLHLGPYRILDRLGQGATGPVFKAIHRTMERIVAVKVLHPRLLRDPITLALFKREVLAASQLHHPGLVSAYHAGRASERHFLVMEYVDGLSLQSLVRLHGPLPIPLACELLRQAADALQYAHEKGIVHRDIKPANLLVSWPASAVTAEHQGSNFFQWSGLPAGPVLKVIDFGLARLHYAGRAGIERTIQADPGEVWGTVDYISPEQAENIHAADIRSDLYSLGCSFYFGLTGQVPFPGNTAFEKLVKHLLHDAPPVTSIRPEVPLAFANIIHRLMAKIRTTRFQIPGELAQELAKLQLPEYGAATTGMKGNLPAPVQSLSIEGDCGRHVKPPQVAQISFSPSKPPSMETRLRDDWRRWTAMVRSYVDSSSPWKQRDAPRRFELLHKRLVEECEAQASRTDGVWREFYQGLAGLVKPWMRPGLLLQADKEIRSSLLLLCQQAELELDQMVTTTTTTGEATTILGRIGSLISKMYSPRRD